MYKSLMERPLEWLTRTEWRMERECGQKTGEDVSKVEHITDHRIRQRQQSTELEMEWKQSVPYNDSDRAVTNLVMDATIQTLLLSIFSNISSCWQNISVKVDIGRTWERFTDIKCPNLYSNSFSHDKKKKGRVCTTSSTTLKEANWPTTMNL